jgi:hypothetical protein
MDSSILIYRNLFHIIIFKFIHQLFLNDINNLFLFLHYLLIFKVIFFEYYSMDLLFYHLYLYFDFISPTPIIKDFSYLIFIILSPILKFYILLPPFFYKIL